VLILAPESAVWVDPAGDGLDAGGLGGFVHHDFYFAHRDSLAAISRQWDEVDTASEVRQTYRLSGHLLETIESL